MRIGWLLGWAVPEAWFSALARKVASIEITGEPKRRYNNTLRGLASLPVSFHAA